MDIETLTLKQIRELQELLSVRKAQENNSHWKIGQAYLIRTVTHYLTGRLIAVAEKELVIGEAAWIADTKQFSNCLREGFSADAEIEAIPDGEAIIGRSALIDAYVWSHPLPRVTQ